MLARLTKWHLLKTVSVHASTSSSTEKPFVQPMFYYPELSRPIMRNMELWKLIVKFRNQNTGRTIGVKEKQLFYQDAQKVLEKALYLLEKYTIPVTSTIQIAQVASSNSDFSLALTVADAFEKVGPHCLKMIVEGDQINDELEVQPSIQLCNVNIYPMFISNNNGIDVYNQCLLVLYNDRFESLEEIKQLISLTKSMKKPLIIILREYDWKAMHDLIRMKLRKKLKMVAVDMGDESNKALITMKDLSILTGTKLMKKGMSDSEVKKALRTVSTAYITEDELLLIGINIEKKATRDHIKKLLMDAKPEDTDLNERIMKLNNHNIALIKIGGIDEEDIVKRMGMAVDTLGRAEQASLHGLIAGDGRCLLDIIDQVSQHSKTYTTNNSGAFIVVEAMKHFYNLVYQSDRSTYYKLSSEKSVLVPKFFGFDTKTKQFVNLISEGIVDPKSYFAQSLLFAKLKCSAYENELGKGLEDENIEH